MMTSIGVGDAYKYHIKHLRKGGQDHFRHIRWEKPTTCKYILFIFRQKGVKPLETQGIMLKGSRILDLDGLDHWNLKPPIR